jgi:hypothetical protein
VAKVPARTVEQLMMVTMIQWGNVLNLYAQGGFQG